jgi:hypothetical protein
MCPVAMEIMDLAVAAVVGKCVESSDRESIGPRPAKLTN